MLRWLGLIIENDPGAMVDVWPCKVEDADVLAYVPVKEEENLNISEDMEQPWKPGNYALARSDYGYYGCDGESAGTIETWEQWRGTVVSLLFKCGDNSN
jgi:hypothetical protein